VWLLVEYFPASEEDSRKPVLFHDLRVGTYLYNRGYSREVVLAGVLHDAIEWSDITEEMLQENFGDEVVRLILASTKDDSIQDKEDKIKELIQRCVENGEEALIVKAADIIDSFKWYAAQENEGELIYCLRNSRAIFEYKLDDFKDPIFEELRSWHDRFRGLN
jgi:(p)ppGpp synthase/HD superfamily hydrolase